MTSSKCYETQLFPFLLCLRCYYLQRPSSIPTYCRPDVRRGGTMWMNDYWVEKSHSNKNDESATVDTIIWLLDPAPNEQITVREIFWQKIAFQSFNQSSNNECGLWTFNNKLACFQLKSLSPIVASNLIAINRFQELLMTELIDFRIVDPVEPEPEWKSHFDWRKCRIFNGNKWSIYQRFKMSQIQKVQPYLSGLCPCSDRSKRRREILNFISHFLLHQSHSTNIEY